MKQRFDVRVLRCFLLAGCYQLGVTLIGLTVEFIVDRPLGTSRIALPVGIAGTFFSLLVLNSIVRAFSLRDQVALIAFWKAKENGETPGSFGATLKNPAFWCEAVVLIASVAALPTGWGYRVAMELLFGEGNANRFLPKCLVTATVTVAYVLFALIARRDAARVWQLDRRNYRVSDSPVIDLRYIPLCLLRSFLLYAVAVPLAICFVSALGTIALFGEILTRSGLPIALAALILLWILCRYCKAFRQRKKFFRCLKVIAREAGYTLENVKNPCLSLLFTGVTCTFSLKWGNQVYSCQVVGCVRRRNRLLFSSDACIHEYRFRLFRRQLFSIRSLEPLTDTRAGRRCIIVLPEPYFMCTGEGPEHPLVPGDKVFSYTLFGAKDFLGNSSRHCLDQ